MNPLLEDRFPIPFDRITADHVKPAVDALLAEAESDLAALADARMAPSFENTMLPLERLTEQLGRCMGIVSHLEHVASSDALRAAQTEAQPRVSELMSRIPLNEPLWRRVKHFADSTEGKKLTGSARRFVDKTVASFRRHGADLEASGKKRLSEIDVELTKLTLRYSQNVLDATNAFELIIGDEAKLAGLPVSARAAAAENAKQKGKEGYRFTLQPSSYLPLLRFLDDASIREHVYRALFSRCTSGTHDNRDLLRRILELRAEKATLLGYASFADLVLEDRMAKTGAEAERFVADLRARTEASFAREREELARFKGGELHAWDTSYYSERLRKELYDFDEETLRPYFAFERVVDGLFQIASRLYRVRFEPWKDAPTWDPSVRTYRVLDEASGAWLAGVYFDPFPRETKQSGAWAHGLVGRGSRESDTRHIAVLVANVTPPLAGQDAQLCHRDVETLFHEFGHLLHHCLSRTELRSQGGTNVAWDFVELPSQIMENWCWERDALDLFAKSQVTGDSIPDELLLALQRARRFQAATMQMRQLGFATMDLGLHIAYDASRDGDPVSRARELMKPFALTPIPEDWAMVAAFEHLFADPVGYAAAYYSYKWAEVLDADAFTRFAREGLFNPEVGGDFREQILARGDEDDPANLFRAFMGRDPDQGALLARLGLEA